VEDFGSGWPIHPANRYNSDAPKPKMSRVLPYGASTRF